MNKEELKRKKEYLEVEHKLKMSRLVYERETQQIFHEKALERGRIKTAEIRKMQERRAANDYSRDYHKQ